jgi:hypothetical protein
MAGPLNAEVILSKCSKNGKSFGIRIEQRNSDWVRTWAFAIDGRKAKNEGFDANTVTGSMNATGEYPGCPHCGSKEIVYCLCKKIGCQGSVVDHGDRRDYTCPCCKEYFRELTTVDSIDVSSGGY